MKALKHLGIGIAAAFAVILSPLPSAASIKLPLVVALGDSITAGTELPNAVPVSFSGCDVMQSPYAWPSRLQSMNRSIRVLNEGIGFDHLIAATVDGQNCALPSMEARLPGLISMRPKVVVLEGSINDVLSGSSATNIESAIGRIASQLRQAHIGLIVVTSPPFVGATDYAPQRQLRAVNQWILQRFPNAVNWARYLSQADGTGNRTLFVDGWVHPNTNAERWLAIHIKARLN